jgi:hypothetical protein
MRLAFLQQPIGTVTLVLALLLPGVLHAQSSTPDLIVTVRDVAGEPLPGLCVQLHAKVGGPALADTVTDALGQAAFNGLTTNRVRVVVNGALPDGTRLVQPDRDAAGIVLFLGPPPTTLDLRVEPSGMVVPDPVTMLDLPSTGPALETPLARPTPDRRTRFPTAESTQLAAPQLVTTPASGLTAATSAPLLSPSTPTGAAVAAPAPPRVLQYVGWGIAIVVVTGLALAIAALRRRHL